MNLARQIATEIRTRVCWGVDPLDAAPSRRYRINFPNGRDSWHVSAAPDGRLFVAVERDDQPVSSFAIDEDFATLTDDSVTTIALLWSRVLARRQAAS